MAASIFTGLSNLSPLLHTQTDADSPINQTLKDGIRYFLEGLAILGFSTGNTGAVTTITETVLTDSGETWTVDEHINRTLVMTSGLAIGNMYQIDDNTADTLTCTGDTMVSDGVAIGDDFEIFFDLLNNTDGHDHDGVNSKTPVLADASITQAKLATGTSSGSISTDATAITGGVYSFYPRTRGISNNSGDVIAMLCATYKSSYGTYIDRVGSSADYSSRYVTSSGEVYWVFIMRDKNTGEILNYSFANDHVCFGNGGNPIVLSQPFGDFDAAKHDMIVINPEPDQVQEFYNKLKEPIAFDDLAPPAKDDMLKMFDIADLRTQTFERGIFQSIAEMAMETYSLDEQTRPRWPTKEVTVDLPIKDKFEIMRRLGEPVKSVKRQIPEPKNILTARLL